MLVSGPSEWSEATLAPKASKTNLLQHAYQSRLRMAAMPQGGSVVITRFASSDANSNINGWRFFEEVMEQPLDHVRLHEQQENATDSKTTDFQFVAWSNGQSGKNLLAIARDGRVEIWEVTNESDVHASLVKSVPVFQNLRGIAWNPVADLLLIFSDKVLACVANEAQAPQNIFSLPAERRDVWKACSWSPNGLALIAMTSSIIYDLSWSSAEVLTSLFEPKVDQFQVDLIQKAVDKPKLGGIAAMIRVSPGICVLTTDTPLMFQEAVTQPTALLGASSGISIQESTNSISLLRIRDPPPSAGSSSSLLLKTISSSNSRMASDSILDLTSLRVTASSSMTSSLQILNRPQEQSPAPGSTRQRPTSHVLVLTRELGEDSVGWRLASTLAVPNLPTPDMLVVQDARIIVGSTLTNRIVVVHMNTTESSWDLSLTGELELPSSHVCRGLFIGERSPFLQAASTEKVKKSVFFHATSAPGPQQIHLSKFKVPRRPRPAASALENPVDSANMVSESAAGIENLSPGNANDRQIFAAKDDKQQQNQQNSDVLAAIVAKLDAMQTQLNTRFDAIHAQLEQLATRMTQFESSRHEE